jgi:Bacterial TSP3 repeat
VDSSRRAKAVSSDRAACLLAFALLFARSASASDAGLEAGVTDAGVVDAAMDPFAVDSDGDGLSDGLERMFGLAVNNADSDGDGLGDAVEFGIQARPFDTDGDGVIDALDADDDGDGISTADEIADGIEYGNDKDGDGLPNYLDTDADGDGLPDRDEGRAKAPGAMEPAYLARKAPATPVASVTAAPKAAATSPTATSAGGCSVLGKQRDVSLLIIAFAALVRRARRRVSTA